MPLIPVVQLRAVRDLAAQVQAVRGLAGQVQVVRAGLVGKAAALPVFAAPRPRHAANPTQAYLRTRRWAVAACLRKLLSSLSCLI